MSLAQSFPLAAGVPVPTSHWDGSLAVDLFAPCGTPVLAVFDGQAIAADYPDGGHTVVLTADDGAEAYYAHLQSPGVSGRVRAGDVVGHVGETGNAAGKGCHLHFAVGVIDANGAGTIPPWDWLAGKAGSAISGIPIAGSVVDWVRAHPLLALGGVAAAWLLLRDDNPSLGQRRGRRMREGDAPDLFGGLGIKTRDTGEDREANRREARREMQRHGAKDLFDYEAEQRNPEFFTVHHRQGRRHWVDVHPIRESSGYDPEVEEVQAEVRQREHQGEAYGGHRQERSDIVRPPWGVGISNDELIRIARKYDTSPYRDGWWEEAGLYSGMGELRYELEAGQHRSTRHRTGSPTRRKRAHSPRHRVAEYDDLPF